MDEAAEIRNPVRSNDPGRRQGFWRWVGDGFLAGNFLVLRRWKRTFCDRGKPNSLPVDASVGTVYEAPIGFQNSTPKKGPAKSLILSLCQWHFAFRGFQETPVC